MNSAVARLGRATSLLLALVLTTEVGTSSFAQPRSDVPAPALWELQKANTCLQKQDYDCAIPALERAIALYSSFVDAMVALGYCYLQKGRVDEAISRCNAAIALSKREPMAYLTLAMAYEQKTDFPKAALNYEAALKLKGSDQAARVGLARAYERMKQPLKAIEQYKQVVSDRADNVAAWTALSQLYSDAKQYKEAESALRQILKVDPGSPSALMRLGSLYIETRQFDKAVESLQAILKIDYNQPIIHFRLGETYLAAGRMEPAMTHYSIATELDPTFLEAKMKLAGLKVDQKQIPQALELYDQVIAGGRSEFLETATERKVRLLLAAGQAARAAEAAEPALELFPDNALLMGLAASRRLQAGQTAPARELAEKLTSRDPNDPQAWSLRGAVELALGENAAAEASLANAVRLDPKDGAALANLGYLAAVRGQKAEARTRFEQALAVRPDLAAVLNNLAVLKMDEQPTEAQELLARASRIDTQSSAIRNNMAVSLARAGKLKEAQEGFDSLARSEPTQADWRWNLALVLHAAGDSARAAEILAPSAQEAGADAGFWQVLGDMYAALGRLDQTDSAYRKALDLDPSVGQGRARILYNLGTIALNRPNRRARAQTILSDALQLDPTLAEAQNNLGCLSFQAGRLDEAKQFFRAAVKQRPNEKSFLLNLLAAGEVMSPDEIARAEQLDARDRNAAETKVADTLLAQGYAALAAKRWPEAIGALDKARDAGVRSAELENAVAVALIRQRRYDEARTRLQAALQISPNAPEALLNMALLHDLGTSQPGEALSYYDKYLALVDNPKISRYVEKRRRFLAGNGGGG